MTPRQFARRLERLVDSTEDLCKELADECLVLIRNEFGTKIDPRGVSWAPRHYGKGRKGVGRRSGTLLVQTHELERDWHIVGVNANGFGISSGAPYSGFIHRGTKFMVARRLVPEGTNLGIWAEPLQKVARAFIRNKLEGR